MLHHPVIDSIFGSVGGEPEQSSSIQWFQTRLPEIRRGAPLRDGQNSFTGDSIGAVNSCFHKLGGPFQVGGLVKRALLFGVYIGAPIQCTPCASRASLSLKEQDDHGAPWRHDQPFMVRRSVYPYT